MLAGQRLRRDLNSALKRAARDANVPELVFTEVERHLVDVAVDLADFSEKLRTRRDITEAGTDRRSGWSVSETGGRSTSR